MTRLDDGFMGMHEARRVPPNPDSLYDLLVGEERLKALESALSSTRSRWDADPAERAADWISHHENTSLILSDLEAALGSEVPFGRIWERFGWAHSPSPETGADGMLRALSHEAARVLALLVKLPEVTARQAIDGISHWLAVWAEQVIVLPECLDVWLKLWPIAVEATNARRPTGDDIDLDTVVRSSNSRESRDLDTRNTPAGKLVGIFLEACQRASESDSYPFDGDAMSRAMRDAAIEGIGQAGLIARYRMIEALPYFLQADPDWTHKHLIPPLIGNSEGDPALWHAIARRRHSREVLKQAAEKGARPAEARRGRKIDTGALQSTHECFAQRRLSIPFRPAPRLRGKSAGFFRTLLRSLAAQ